tara:strand:- start:6616 stop:7323 length:708 start_codon:yes stop_codon:yes gene_type:complete
VLPAFTDRRHGRAAQQLRRSLAAHKGRKRFVEGHIGAHPYLAVGQFVKKQFGKLRIRPVDERAEQRIGEPTQGGIGGNPANMSFQTAPTQARGVAFGPRATKVPSVRRAPYQWIAPGMRTYRQLRRREYVPERIGCIELHEAAVAPTHLQAELVGSKRQQLLGVGQALAQPLILRSLCLGQAGQHNVDILSKQQDGKLTRNRLRIEAQRLASGQEQQQHRANQSPQHAVAPSVQL